MRRFLWLIGLGIVICVRAEDPQERDSKKNIDGLVHIGPGLSKDPPSPLLLKKMENANKVQTLLIFPFENATVNPRRDALKRGIPDLVTAFLSPYSDSLNIIDRDRLDDLLSEHALKRENLMTEAGMQQLGRLAQARYILRGSFTESDKTIHVQALLYETESLRLVKSVQSTNAQKTLNAACQTIADGIAGFFSAPIKPLADLPSEPNPETNLYMVQGLGFYYQGRYTKAFPEFMKILQKEPKNADARYWLGKSFAGAGLKEQARLEFQQFLAMFAKDSRAPEVKIMMGK